MKTLNIKIKHNFKYYNINTVTTLQRANPGQGLWGNNLSSQEVCRDESGCFVWPVNKRGTCSLLFRHLSYYVQNILQAFTLPLGKVRVALINSEYLKAKHTL